MTHRTWVKIFCEGWLDGTLREESPELRGIWADILAWAGDVDGISGTIRVAKAIGYTDEQIAARLNIELSMWIMCKKRLIKTERIKVVENNIIEVCKWKKYQSDYGRQKQYRGTKLQTKVTNKSYKQKLQTEVEVEVEVDKEESKQAEIPSAKVKSPSSKSKSKPKVEIPAAVEIYHRLTSLYPAKTWWPEISETVSDYDPNALKLWFRIVHDWLGMGWSPKSVKLMLENFKKRQIPGEKDQEWIPADIEPAPVDITEEQAEANRKRLAGMIAGITARMTV